MSSDHEDRWLRVMIEEMQRKGCSEREIVRAVEQGRRPGRPSPRKQPSLRKAVHVGRWRVEVARR